MKISLAWLKDYVSFDLSVDSLVHRLTMAGLEVEKIENVSQDTVLELEITPNRPDCLNMIGMARELAAILAKPLKLPVIPEIVAPKKKCEITIEDKEGCRRYIGALIENVNIEPASDGLASRLSALGVRLINNVVDITNFCLFETGQPLHAFDYDKLQGGRIVVRRAKKGEKIVTLDGVERTLDPSILVIADAGRPVALAGIMGGKDTEVTSQTKRVLLESACFDSVLIRRACRQLGLSSDSSYRFERGVDWFMIAEASARAVALILEAAGGRLAARNDIVLSAKKTKPLSIKMAPESVSALLGVNIPTGKIQASLKRLGFDVKMAAGKQFLVTPPSFRGDVNREVDLIEEVARMIGYDQLPTSLPQIKFSGIPLFYRREFKHKARKCLAAQGLDEVITYALVSRDLLEKAQLGHLKCVRVQNPLSQEQEIMRPAVLPSLLNVVRTNFNRGEKNLRFFEMGKVYFPSGEKEVLSWLLTGAHSLDWRMTAKGKADFYDLKGVAEELACRLDLPEMTFSPMDDPIFVSGEGASIFAQGQAIGLLGRVNPKILSAWDIKHEDVFFGQLDLEYFFKLPAKRRAYQLCSEYPAITRDISLAIKEDISYSLIPATILKLGIENLATVSFKEQYLGEKIPAGYRGVTFSLLYQSTERTLTEEEIQAVHSRICQTLVDKFGAVLR